MAAPSTPPHDETQYLELIRNVLATGETRPDRTGTGTLSIFAPPNLRFSLADSTLPLLTTKRTFLRGILEELLWFVYGATDFKLLSDKGVEKRGLGQSARGGPGAVYGFQWRHFWAKYEDCDKSYAGEGVDQLKVCIRKIKEDPTDRRFILSIRRSASSFFCFQVIYVLTFNIASYALLTHMIAHITDTEPRELVIQLGDAHVNRDDPSRNYDGSEGRRTSTTS